MSAPLPLNTLHRYADVAARANLVNLFNHYVGLPSPNVAAMQRDFLTGTMERDDQEALVRLYEFSIDDVENAKRF